MVLNLVHLRDCKPNCDKILHSEELCIRSGVLSVKVRFQSSDTTWKPSLQSCSSPSSSEIWLFLPFLNLNLQVPLLLLGEGLKEFVGLGKLVCPVMKIWLELVVGGMGAGRGKLDGRWMGGLLVLLRMPMREGFFWACSACCWLTSCCWRSCWKSSWKSKKRNKSLKG